ncbi:IS66 family transposase [Vibrio cholerae]|nr:IS66 family transposase [Vibrio cholerae]
MKKKKSKFADAPPVVSDIHQANALIEELWAQLREYEDKLKTSGSNSSKPPSSDGPKERAERKKPQSSGGRHSRGAKPGHTGHQRQLSALKETDSVVECWPDTCCPCCGESKMVYHKKPFYRHQVHEIPNPRVDITEYQLYSGQCQYCREVSRARLPEGAPQGIMGPNLLSYTAVLAGQYHLSVRKIQSLLKEQLGTTFSIGAISEAQTKVASMLTPLHQAIRAGIQKAPMVHIDETSHPRNDESRLRWCWLASSEDLVYEKILYSRSSHSAKLILGDAYSGVIISDQCPSYNWIPQGQRQLCWSHIKRNLQQIADYSGGGFTARVGRYLTFITSALFRTRHRFEQNELCHKRYMRRMLRLQKAFDHWLEKGRSIVVKRYKGRCEKLEQHRQSLWLFLKHESIPLTNNEAELRIRGSVIQRKISFGTTSDAGDKFRGRMHTLVETCKKRGLSSLSVLTEIVQAVTARQPYPNVLGL